MVCQSKQYVPTVIVCLMNIYIYIYIYIQYIQNLMSIIVVVYQTDRQHTGAIKTPRKKMSTIFFIFVRDQDGYVIDLPTGNLIQDILLNTTNTKNMVQTNIATTELYN